MKFFNLSNGNVKKISSAIIAVVILMAISIVAFADKNDHGFTYEIMDGSIVITGVKGDPGEVLSIPEKIENLTVKVIGKEAFADNQNIREVLLPKTVEKIDTKAFNNCINLEKISFSENLTTIEDRAFSNCTKLINIPPLDNIKTIGSYAFEYCRNIQSVSLKNAIEIGGGVFANCNNLTKAVLSDKVTEIPDEMFITTGLKEFEFPNNLTSIGKGAFCDTPIANVKIPESVTRIGDSAFAECKNIMEIKLPENLKEIGFMAFSGTSISKVQIPSKTEFLDGSFYRCIQLEKIEFAQEPRLKRIGSWCFMDTAIKEFTVPETVKEIGSEVFVDMNSLTTLIFNEGLEKVGKDFVLNCPNLKTVVLPDTLVLPDSFSVLETGKPFSLAWRLKVVNPWTYFEYPEGLIMYCNSNTSAWNYAERNKIKNSPLVKVLFNGEKIEFDQLPIIENSRTLVPLRAIFEKLGAEVTWDEETQTVTAVKENTKISLAIGSNTMYINGASIKIDVPAKVVNSRTLVPVRVISECFGFKVDWQESSKTVVIKEI